MNKDQYDPESEKIFKGLLTAVIVVEIVNIIMSVLSGVIQADSCPVNTIPAIISVFLSSVAVFMALMLPFFCKKEIFVDVLCNPTDRFHRICRPFYSIWLCGRNQLVFLLIVSAKKS
jgi:hypothetical protein